MEITAHPLRRPSMSRETEPNPARLRLWQQNLNQSDKAHFDLINSLVHNDWDLLLLQEPYIDMFGNTKVNSKWHTIYPSSHLTDNATNRSVILVNVALDSNSWAQLPFEGSNNVTVLQFSLPPGCLTIFNIYNDCTHSDTLSKLHQYLDQHSADLLASEVDHMIWCSNFNRHHPLWDEEHNKHLFMASASVAVQLLLSLLEEHNMIMLLPKGIPTLQLMATGNWTRVDNVFATANMEGLVVICDTAPGQRGPSTDHVPVLTTLELSVPV